MELMKRQQHLLKLFASTTSKQGKVLLQTITREQLKAVSQIAHNVLQFTIRLRPEVRDKLKRKKQTVHILGSKKAGYKGKKRAVVSKQRLVCIIIKAGLSYLEPALK